MRDRIQAFVLRRVVLYTQKRGMIVMDAEAVRASVNVLTDLKEFIDRSGHLNSVRKRQPHSYKRILSAFAAIEHNLNQSVRLVAGRMNP